MTFMIQPKRNKRMPFNGIKQESHYLDHSVTSLSLEGQTRKHVRDKKPLNIILYGTLNFKK